MSELIYRRLRAPSEDGTALIEPPLKHAAELVAQNRAQTGNRRYDCQGLRLEAMGFHARAELRAKATAYTGAYRDASFAPSITPATPFILSGHQPELYHPGVWFKSFLLSAVGRQTGAVALNLIVDTDQVRRTTIAVPIKDGRQGAIENVAFDATGDVVPYEERSILDAWLFDSFDERVRVAYETCRVDGHEPYLPLIEALWKAAVAAAQRQGKEARLGHVLAEARHVLESLLGLATLELPLSTIAQTRDFRWFAIHLLAQLPRLWRIYNAALAEYRGVNHIRSDTHPVSSLQEHHDWLEAPFLVWTKDDPRRRHLFARQTRSSLVLGDRQGLQLTLDFGPDGPLDAAVEQVAAAEQRGIRIRPRALITTMYARLILSDLFIHGIGGAKYDELTDLIIRRFFGIEPPAYVTATATLRLPIERPQVTADDVCHVLSRIRDVRYRPESFVGDRLVEQDAATANQLHALAAEKRDFLDKHDLRRCPKEVFNRLDRINRAMHSALRPIEEQLRAEHAHLVEEWKRSQLLGSREFSFCLFPSEILSARLLDLCKVSS